ncbi:hypothetical protein JF66_02785 [Cryobacterium sp. MLB-32]|uniref:M56 family metallopeptidase n=1 Tax=Cryobacterium sp. MLB-32 TaxID=1529318 RepID=UPI0004E70755|nr:M56 family metallopeptidase [Cryobacterium sp. MLB-32]KFF60660.1 hypothetical protein JF66_02785 [Cryobacterium sp. MLB-32]
MLSAALVLGVVALALAWPLPVLLAGARWPARSPGIALALWQAIALAGGFSMIGSLLCYGLIPFGADVRDGVLGLGEALWAGTPAPTTTFAHVLALCGALLLGTHLVLNLASTFVRAEGERRRHHHLINLLSDPLPDRPGMRVIDYAAPVAYCLPGAIRSATVLSNGLLRLLDGDQLRGVIAHEQAHLRQQHHLVLLAFKSWRSALPWFPIANRAEHAVALLVEMLADDHARRVIDDRTLATAIALVGLGQQPEAGSPESAVPAWAAHVPEQPLVAQRVHRLMTPAAPLSSLESWAALTSAIVLVISPAVVLVLA